MGAKLAVLLAATVVFAPGRGEGPAAARLATPSELAGTILAPTFEEARNERLGEPTLAKAFDRADARRSSNGVVGVAPNLAVTEPSFQLLLAALVALAFGACRRLSIVHPQRGPPHFPIA